MSSEERPGGASGNNSQTVTPGDGPLTEKRSRWVVDQPDTGSGAARISASAPLFSKRSGPPKPTPASPSASNDSVPRKKILIADDIKEIRDILRAVLATRYEVVVARNGEEAWELFNSEKPDIVLTDMIMPRMKGDELCHRIKTESFRRDTPVILITAATKDKELADGFWNKAAGSDGYISKPFSPLEVLQKVDALLANK